MTHHNAAMADHDATTYPSIMPVADHEVEVSHIVSVLPTTILELAAEVIVLLVCLLLMDVVLNAGSY